MSFTLGFFFLDLYVGYRKVRPRKPSVVDGCSCGILGASSPFFDELHGITSTSCWSHDRTKFNSINCKTTCLLAAIFRYGMVSTVSMVLRLITMVSIYWGSIFFPAASLFHKSFLLPHLFIQLYERQLLIQICKD